jgi:hypothetical protein
MKSPNGGAERVTADALDRFWDSLVTAHARPGGPHRPDELLDPALTRTVRQVRMIDATPHPEPGFAGQLWADLMAGQLAPASPPAIPMTGRLRALTRHRFLTELAVAAALLVVLLGGGAALELPVALDPAVPTAAASTGGESASEPVANLACAGTVTPEPTRIARFATVAPTATTAPGPAVLALPAEPC